MKKSLKRHIDEIFYSLKISHLHFDVYECQVDTLPIWASHLLLTHEFLICSEASLYTNKLQKFLRKEIYQIENKIYWFEGSRIIKPQYIKIAAIENISTKDETSTDYLKTETRLPIWLDDFIFKKLNANYSPDYNIYEYNLDLSPEENLVYIGTYFPRSYAESFCICDNLFQNKIIKKIFQSKKEITILIVGCGTGGDLLGLLTVIEKYYTERETINIYAIDGNENALAILSCLIDKFQSQTDKKIDLKVRKYVFSDIPGINLHDLKIDTVCFDFVFSFKMICEIISKGKGIYDNSYYDFVKKFVPLLSKDGICILLDVTTKQKHSTFNPILMNRQVNSALREMNDYQTLLPLSCNLYEKRCNTDCFCQKIFTVSHTKHSCDKSKVAYRIIIPKSLGIAIGKPMSNLQYEIQSDRSEMCLYTEQYKKITDSYNIKQLKIN
jgi:SAM-dependent methyltransferase